MPGRCLRHFVVAGLIVSLGMFPWSSAQAAPAHQSLSTSLGPTMAQTLHRLFTAFRLLLQQDQNGNPPPGNPPPGNSPNGEGDGNPSNNPQDGVGIDPNGRRGN